MGYETSMMNGKMCLRAFERGTLPNRFFLGDLGRVNDAEDMK
jgi:hypothetical protein